MKEKILFTVLSLVKQLYSSLLKITWHKVNFGEAGSTYNVLLNIYYFNKC